MSKQCCYATCACARIAASGGYRFVCDCGHHEMLHAPPEATSLALVGLPSPDPPLVDSDSDISLSEPDLNKSVDTLSDDDDARSATADLMAAEMTAELMAARALLPAPAASKAESNPSRVMER